MPALTACLDLNFTGATTFTSRTGVKKEIFRYVPIMAFMAGSGVVLSILLRVIALMRVIKMFNSYLENTLKYHPDRCINCRRCTQVCPRGVFAEGEERVELIQPASCMECGACTLNARPRQYKCRVVLAAHGQWLMQHSEARIWIVTSAAVGKEESAVEEMQRNLPVAKSKNIHIWKLNERKIFVYILFMFVMVLEALLFQR